MSGESIAQLAAALSKAQAEMKHAAKDADNPFFHSKYADLAGVTDACRPALAKYGLSVVQTTRIGEYEGKPINILRTILLHESGESIEGEVVLRPMRQEKNVGWVHSEDPQSIGSAMTYARRYALAAITGVATEDDDGNAATGNKAEKQQARQEQKQSPAGSPPPPATEPGGATPPASPDEPTEDQVRKDLEDTVLSIAGILGKDFGSIMHELTVSSTGKFGKRSVNDLDWIAPKKAGGTWSPLKACLKKAKDWQESIKPVGDGKPYDDVQH